MVKIKHSTIKKLWYQPPTWVNTLLLPFSHLFGHLIRIRRWLYQNNVLSTIRPSIPTVVVGNITAGGTGKTPFIIALTHLLEKEGFKPIIITKGYGGKKTKTPVWATQDSDPSEVGDETVLLCRRVRSPVISCPNRKKSIQLIQKLFPDRDILLSDDGLQHYALKRDVEIAIIDGHRGFGNGYLLPAGPLREPISRLKEVDCVVINEPQNLNKPLWKGATFTHLMAESPRSVMNPNRERPIEMFKSKAVHAVAGIGNPERFFHFLKSLGLSIIEHTFPDHYIFSPKDIDFGKQNLVLMTEKDAVKCKGFSDQRHWYLPVQMQLDSAEIKNVILTKLSRRMSNVK